MSKMAFYLDSLAVLHDHLLGSFETLQLVKDAKSDVHWSSSTTEDAAPLYGSENLPQVSPKALLFPPLESLYRFDGSSFEALTPEVKPMALLGVQACDLVAIAYQDKFFKDDPHYQKRRQQMLLVGVDCESPCQQGFCHEVDAGPHVREQTADLIVSRNTSSDDPAPWIVFVSTEKGQNAIKGLTLRPAQSQASSKRRQQEAAVVSQFKDFSYINNGIECINDNNVPAEVWEQVGLQCLTCSGCSNLCPTCSCYSVYDEPNADNGEVTTVRCWDSCLFEGFQKEASGHNPSHGAGQRIERFWYHKFSDDYLPEFGRYGCVGCGRCEGTCPGSVGVHSVMKRIEQSCCS